MSGWSKAERRVAGKPQPASAVQAVNAKMVIVMRTGRSRFADALKKLVFFGQIFPLGQNQHGQPGGQQDGCHWLWVEFELLDDVI